MKQFEVVRFEGNPGVVVSADDLPDSRRAVVIPLLQGYPAIPRLDPEVRFDGKTYTLATMYIASGRSTALQSTGHNVSMYRDEIIRAMDILNGSY